MTMDFHHLIKGAEGLIPGDSTRKDIIKEEPLAHQISCRKNLCFEIVQLFHKCRGNRNHTRRVRLGNAAAELNLSRPQGYSLRAIAPEVCS